MGRAEVEALLVSSGAYRDLDAPVIVTSGEFLTPFYVNAERLCGDPEIDEALARMAEDHEGMIRYACDLAQTNEGYGRVVDALCEEARAVLPASGQTAVSGGQRRDWLFSGPVAARLGLPHISLFKQSPGADASADRVVGVPSPAGMTVVHIVDMVTKASSCYDVDPATGREVGWIPMLRSRGAEVRDLIAVVTRAQGGEGRLSEQGVTVRSLAVVDGAFVDRNSRDAEAVAGYVDDPVAWTRGYLRSHGVGVLLPFLEDTPKKLPRAVKFLRTYRGCLEDAGLWPEIERESRARMGRSVEEILG